MKYQNPILSGFHPDPSICRVGEDYYLVTSSFEYFPGLPLFHSRDLIHWQQLGHCISRNSQLTLSHKVPNGFGLYAPTIRHHNGRFYVICTNVSEGNFTSGNFVIWTDDIHGEWSDPIWIDLPGIDPSLYFEGDKAFYVGTHKTIYLCELDLSTGATGPRHELWQGIGAADPEGPHLYKKGDYYYLVIAEGGTSFGHMVTIARSKNMLGPYEAHAENPILTNRSLQNQIQAVGHADLIEDHLGNWWGVCLGIRTIGTFTPKHLLGRETFLFPVDWSRAWPILGNNGSLSLEMEATGLPEKVFPNQPAKTIFSKQGVDATWNYLYEQDDVHIFTDEQGLNLLGSAETLNSEAGLTWLGRRQTAFNFSAKAKFILPKMEDGTEFGLSIFLNRQHHYEIALQQDEPTAIIFRQTVSIFDKMTKVTENSLMAGTPYYLEIRGDKKLYQFFGGTEENSLQKIGEATTVNLTTEVGGLFTGPYLALYATGNGKESVTPIVCEWFDYQRLD